MKVALYTSKFLPTVGGSEIVIDNLARSLITLGVEVAVIAPWSRGSHRSDQELPYKVFRHLPFISKRYAPRFYRKVLQQIYLKFPFEILHCQQTYPAVVLGARFKEKHPEVGLFFTSHGHDLDRNYSRYQNRYLFEGVKQSLLSVDGFISLNPSLKKQFLDFNKKALILESSNGTILNNSFTTSSRYILFLGRLSKRKGIDVLLTSFSQISSNDSVTLVIAGSGREDKRLKKLAAKLDIKSKVAFIGQVSGETKMRLIAESLFVVIPTISWEASSLVAIEAISNGKAIVASNIVGINQLITDRANGLLVKPNDPDLLKNAMLELLENEKLRGSIEQQNYSLRENFCWDKIATDYLGAYRKVIDAKNRL